MDGTLTVSKSRLSDEMSKCLSDLLSYKEVFVISGGRYSQFETQFLSNLKIEENKLKKLHLLPTCATVYYKWNDGWKELYKETLSEEEKRKIFEAFKVAFDKCGFVVPEKPLYGEIIEDRETQITFSALGQQAPIELKEKWDKDFSKRIEMMKVMIPLLPEFEVRAGGTTSIDVTRKGIDKAYGIRKLMEQTGFKTNEIIFIGDALFEGGNDYPVTKTGVKCFPVTGPDETMFFIRKFINSIS